MIIDIHYHIADKGWWSEKFWDGLAVFMGGFLAKKGVGLSVKEVKSTLFHPFWDPTGEILLRHMDEAGIDKTVLLACDFGLTFGREAISAEEINKVYSNIAKKHPDRLIAFAGVDPRRENAVDILDRCINDWAMKGLKIHPAAGFYPNEKMAYPLYEKANELGIPIMTHTGAMIYPLRSKYAQPIYLDDILIDFPNLKIIAPHLSFGWWPELTSLLITRPNLYTDFSLWQLTASHNYQTFCHTLRAVLDAAGSERVFFGSDGPFFRHFVSDREWIQIIKDLPQKAPKGIIFTEEEVEGMLGKNAKKLLGL